MLSETYGRWEVSKPNTPDFSATVKCYDDSILKIIECMCDP